MLPTFKDKPTIRLILVRRIVDLCPVDRHQRHLVTPKKSHEESTQRDQQTQKSLDIFMYMYDYILYIMYIYIYNYMYDYMTI